MFIKIVTKIKWQLQNILNHKANNSINKFIVACMLENPYTRTTK